MFTRKWYRMTKNTEKEKKMTQRPERTNAEPMQKRHFK